MGWIRKLATKSRRGAKDTSSQKKLTPFPTKQILVLALCRICEPIAFISIFPYVYYMVKDFNIAEDPTRISFYAGMVTSAFTFAEFSTGILWGRLSDRIGRKPVLLMGLAGTGISALLFGFAQNLPAALFARALGGLLNGNLGVLQTTVAELATVKEHQPRAYSIMPLVWCLGSIIGPIIGGALARPCISYPGIFVKGTIWERFPYLLPNLLSASVVFCGVVVGLLLLEETHVEKKKKCDPGLKLGRQLSSWVLSLKWKWQVPKVKKDELRSLLDTDFLDSNGELPEYRSSGSSPRLSSLTLASLEDLQLPDLFRPAGEEIGNARDPERAQGENSTAKPVKIFTKPIVLNIVSYGILAFHTMTFDQLFPVFLSTVPQGKQDQFRLPFKFSDGFGMETKNIGVILSVQGAYSMISTAFLVPLIIDRLGALKLFRCLATSYFLLYLIMPYLVLLPENLRMVGIYFIIIWKCTFSSLAYPANAILLTNSAPTSSVLGMINGVAASTASLCRAFGPVISGFLYTMGLKTGYSGLAWWCSGVITLGGALVSVQLTESRGRLDAELVPPNTQPDA